jgi:tripartite-type tricarboxylate transporter receptor subunit TctC
MIAKFYCRKIIFVVMTISIGLLAFNCTWASDFPTREIELISPHAPGSSADIAARNIAANVQRYLSKPLVVVNKPGGSGAKGPTYVAQAKPDGYTLGVFSQSGIAQPYLMKGVTFHYKKSYRAIAQSDTSSTVLYVVKGGKYDVSLKELIRMLREKPESIKIGIGGKWTVQDFSTEILQIEAGIKFNKIPFPDVAAAVPALLGGHIDAIMASTPAIPPLYNAGTISVLGNSQEQRDPLFPKIPTFKEQGYNVVVPNTRWIVAPAGTPDDAVNFLANAFRQGLTSKEYKEACERVFARADWAGPEDSMKSMERVEQLYLTIIKKYNLKPE